MVAKLTLYNNALVAAHEEMLGALTDETKGRRLCDQFYDQVLFTLLESGNWKFAMRTAKLEPDSAITPEFGHVHVYTKTTDWRRTYRLSADERFHDPLRDYTDDGGTISTDANPLFVKFVSSDSSYGGDLGRWPQLFTNAFSLALGAAVAPGLTASRDIQDALLADADTALTDARSKDAFQGPPAELPTGRWVRARGTGGQRMSRVSGGWIDHG